MPSPRDKTAPYFSGEVDIKIEDFLKEYEELADGCGLSERQKVETVIRYVNTTQRHIWMSLSGFVRHDWDDLCRELRKEYISPTAQGRFSKQKLVELTNRSARLPMEEETDVINYHRDFNTLSKPLLEAGRITAGERNAFFWRGFHPEDRQALRERLIAKQPNRPKGQAFDLQDVLDTAIAIFSGDDDLLFQEPPPRRHETDRARERRTGHSAQNSRGMSRDGRATRRERYRETSPFEDQESDDQEAPSPDDYEYPNRGHRHSSSRVETRSVRFKDIPREEDQEMEDLIRQLHSLPVRDPSYAVLYARCATRFPDAMMSIPKPEYRTSATATTYSYQTTAPPPPPPQPWSAHAAPPAPFQAPLAANASTAPSYYRLGPRPEVCSFCYGPGHRIRECPVGDEYVRSGRATIVNGRIHLPNGQPIPYDGTRRGLRASIDSWLAAQTAPAPTTAQTRVVFAREPPPHLDSRSTPTSRIEEVVETHILQVKGVATDNEEQEFSHDILEVFAAEKKKRDDKKGKAPELSAPPKENQARPAAPSNPRPNAQFRYHSNAEDQRLVTELEDYLMQGKLSLTTPAHVFAASPAIRKDVVDKLKVRRVEANEYEAVSTMNPSSPDVRIARATTVRDDDTPDYPPSLPPTDLCLPLQELDVLIGGSIKTPAIFDTGSQIVVIRLDLVQSLGVYINTQQLIEMEGANGATNWTVGCAENLTLQVGDVPFKIHAHVVEHASFGLLLGRPFQRALLCRFEDLPGGEVEVSVRDPADISRRVYVPTRPRTGRAPAVKIISVVNHSTPSAPPPPEQVITPHPLPPLPPADPAFVFKYKTVDKKVRPVPATLPEEFRTVRRIPEDPLLTLPPLPTHPPDFTPGERLTQERLDELNLNSDGFLWPEELKLVTHVLKLNELALAWTEAEKGRFKDEYFDPVKIPVIEHVPWAHKNLPIPPGILEEVIKLFREKVAAGVYESSDASYRSRWFCVKKKSGALRIVHDLQPLNAVTIRNAGLPPDPEQIIASMAGRSCYTVLDLFVGYDHRTLDEVSRDLTTVSTPVGTQRLTCMPQGWTGAVAIFHGDIVFILEPEIPDPAEPFLDDTNIKGPKTRFETEDGGYETIPANPQIRRFIWIHVNDVHRILHRFLCAGATISAKKLAIARPEVSILGHKCTYEGRIPDDSKVSKIREWPECKNLSDVRAFLGITGYMRIWIKDYSSIARPLVNLTRKGTPFEWQEEHEQAMQALKTAIVQSSALISIDYSTDRAVYLSVDSSIRGVGWILAQDCSDGRRRPSRFGSISWNERESRYSQAKLELYGLFRALRAMRLYIVGVRNLVVEVDASYIKGMLRNPDIQPNASINRWIAAILLFDFKLVHVPADKHKGPDGLSRREPVPGEDEEDDDPEDWVDNALALGVWVVSWVSSRSANSSRPVPLALSITVDDASDDEDTAQLSRPRRNRRLPARYRSGDYVSSPHTSARSRLLASDSNPNNDEDTADALQQQGISTIAREGAQPQATASPSTPTVIDDSPAAERYATDTDDDDGVEERNEDAGGDVRSPFYTDLDKRARASNNNNDDNNSISYRKSGNAQNARDSRALGSRGELPTIDSDIDISRRCNSTDDINENIHTTSTPQTLDDINNTSDCRHPIPTQFSTSVKADKAEEDLANIRRYLISRRAPPDLSGDALTRFISRTRRFLISGGRLWRRQADGRHQLYASPSQRYALVRDAHDKLGHKGLYSTRRTLLDRFWWPALESDVKWYVQTCHECQIRQTTQVRLPPTVDTPAPLFRKVHIDTMFMPHAGGYRYIVQARCSLTAWPEWRALRVETGKTIGAFIFEEILCRWGAVEEIVTDNGTAYVAALDWLADRYGIRHIRISAYNSQANGIVERQHRTIRDTILKACEGNYSRWPTFAPFAFWADRATTRKSTGFSPYYMVHGVEPILPFDLAMATFLVPDLTMPLSTEDLLIARARQLQKRPADLAAIHDRIIASRFASARRFERQHANTIRDFDFASGALVLVRSAGSDMDKTRPRYYGPMVVLRRTRHGAYRLSELDGAISRLRYAAFRLIPYHARSRSFIPVTQVVGGDDLASLEHDDSSVRGAGYSGDELTREGQILNPPGGVMPVVVLASETSRRTPHSHIF